MRRQGTGTLGRICPEYPCEPVRMNTRWLWLDHIPADLGLTRAERRAVRHLANELRERLQVFPSRFTLIFTIVVFAFLCAIAGVLIFATDKALAVVVALALITVVGVTTYIRWRARGRYIRLALRAIGHEVCVDCSYVLHGLGDIPTCPECGSLRVLMVRRRKQPAGRGRSIHVAARL